MSINDTLCFADYDLVTGPPTVDGFTGIDDAGVITTEAEPGYVLGSRLTYSNSSLLPPVIFQGVKNGNFLNFGFFCRFGFSFTEKDVVIIALKPSPSAGQDQARRIEIYPNYDAVGADEKDGMTGGPAGTPDDNPPGVPAGDNFHIRTNHTPDNVQHYRGQLGTVPWTTTNPDNSTYAPTGITIKVRSWKPPVPTTSYDECAWSVEIQVPLTNQLDPTWITLPDSFGLYFNVVRVYDSTYATWSWPPPVPAPPATDIGGDPDPLGGFLAAQFPFPNDSPYLSGNLDTTTVIPAYGTGLIPDLQNPPGSNLGQGVSFAGGEAGVGVRPVSAAAWSALGSLIEGAGSGGADNRLVAQVQNTSSTKAQQVSVTFRFANWGLGPAGIANWQTPIGATPDPGPPPSPTSIADITGTDSAELTWTWPVAAVPSAYSPPNAHQCMWVQLDSAFAVNFTQSSIRRNMDFQTLSNFERPAHISGVGYPPPAGGKTHHDFVLFVNARQITAPQSHGTRVVKARDGTWSVRAKPVQWTWILSGFRRTGETLVIGEQAFEVLDDAPGAFGFVFQHEGATDTLHHELTGSGLRPFGNNAYRLKVPHGGEVVIHTKFKTTPAKPVVPPPTPPPEPWPSPLQWPALWWLLILAALVIGLLLGWHH